jgi:ribosome biogenesis GTPase / thiamine phosphate phosphatase
MSAEPVMADGVVSRLDARGCLVRLDAARPEVPGDGRDLWCTVAGRVHLKDRTDQKAPVAVGDRVRVLLGAKHGATVAELYPRRSLLSRPAVGKSHVEHVMAVNVDQVLVVTSAADPEFNPAFVDRILAVSAWCRLEGLLVVNKMDLVPAEPPEAAVYRALGMRVFPVSARDGSGVPALRAALADKVSVATGHSGVGKSSVLNAVTPGLGLAVGEVNQVSRRGTHTTTAAVRMELPGGGAVIDTAGVREFGLFHIPARDLTWLFPDLAKAAAACRFPDCSHTHEPGCAVAAAVEAGQVAPFRYDSYLKILESMGETR